MTPSQIGVLLRDSMGIPQVRAVTGAKILRILKVLLGEMSVKQAAQLTARITGLKKNLLYRRALEIVEKQRNG